MNLSDARAIAAAYLKEDLRRPEGFTPIIVDSATKETEFGWVFFYDSDEHLRSSDVLLALAGNAPIAVMKADGKVQETGTCRPLDDYLAEIRVGD
jgi:hypothetical protein